MVVAAQWSADEATAMSPTLSTVVEANSRSPCARGTARLRHWFLLLGDIKLSRPNGAQKTLTSAQGSTGYLSIKEHVIDEN